MDSDGKVLKLTTPRGRGPTAEGKRVSREYLVNKLNSINFKSGTILVILRHATYGGTISLMASPLPCLGDSLQCVWAENDYQGLQTSSYRLKSILVPDGQRVLLVEPVGVSVDEKGISFRIPDACKDVNSREAERHPCRGIEVRFCQNSVVFHGKLVDFSSVAFRVEVNAAPTQTFEWIDTDIPANITLSEEGEILYTGECGILKRGNGSGTSSYVAKPLMSQLRRFRRKDPWRNPRQKLVPSPDLTFLHPFTKRINSLKVLDIASLGFSVEEHKENAVLLPGMVIPEAVLGFANGFNVGCKAQVVYRALPGEGGEDCRLRCGLAIMDIDTGDHARLLSMLYQAEDSYSYLGGSADLDDLWDFFFEANFVYPEKYGAFVENRERIKDTYKKLYTSNPDIIRHFTYRERGRIKSHMAMVRFYGNSWLVQHHAALGDGGFSRAGLRVLDQANQFLNDSHRLYAMRMRFVFHHYQPDKRSIHRLWWSLFESIDDLKACSVDKFAYFHINRQVIQETRLGDQWRLVETEPQDLFELQQFYEFHSGGLMLNALDLRPDSNDLGELSAMYQKLGLKRQRFLHSLKRGESLKAVFLVDVSDVGLNLSDLTSSFKVIVVDPDGLTRDVLYSALSGLFGKYESNSIPVLLYPATHAANAEIPCERSYNIWVLSMQYLDRYLDHVQKYCRRKDRAESC